MADGGERQRVIAEILDLEPAMHRAMGPARPKNWVDVEITMSQLKILFVLHSSILPGGAHGLLVTEVARFLGVTLPTVTAVMDKLVERELVRRDEDPNDRRQHVCRLTSTGQQLVESLIAGHRAYTEALLAYMEDDDLTVILRGMHLLIDAAERFRAGEPPSQSTIQGPKSKAAAAEALD